MRARVVRCHVSIWLDGVISALGAGSLAVAFLLGPLLRPGDGSFAVVITNLAYPVADLMLLVLLVGACGLLGARGAAALLWLGAGLALNLAADIGFLLAELAGTYVEGGPLDLVWLLAVAAFGVAAGTRREPSTDPSPVDNTSPRVGRSPCLLSRTSRAWESCSPAGEAGCRRSPPRLREQPHSPRSPAPR